MRKILTFTIIGGLLINVAPYVSTMLISIAPYAFMALGISAVILGLIGFNLSLKATPYESGLTDKQL